MCLALKGLVQTLPPPFGKKTRVQYILECFPKVSLKQDCDVN